MLKIYLTHVYHVFTQTIKYFKTKAVSLAALKSILKKKYFIPFTKCISSPLKRSLI